MPSQRISGKTFKRPTRCGHGWQGTSFFILTALKLLTLGIVGIFAVQPFTHTMHAHTHTHTWKNQVLWGTRCSDCHLLCQWHGKGCTLTLHSWICLQPADPVRGTIRHHHWHLWKEAFLWEHLYCDCLLDLPKGIRREILKMKSCSRIWIRTTSSGWEMVAKSWPEKLTGQIRPVSLITSRGQDCSRGLTNVRSMTSERLPRSARNKSALHFKGI